MSKATDNDYNPPAWQGVNRNTGKSFAGPPSRTALGRQDREGGPMAKDGQKGKGSMTKAGGQTPADAGQDDMGDEDSYTSSNLSIINFPDEIGTPKQPNYMTFRTWKITSAVGGTMTDMSFKAIKAGDGVSQVALPIPTGVGAAYGQGWDQSDVNATQGALMRSFGSGFGNAMKSTATDGIGGAPDASMGGGPGGAKSPTEMIGDMGSTLASAGKAALGSLSYSADIVGGYNKATGAISKIAAKIGQSQLVGNAVAGVGLGVAGKVLGDGASTALGVASFNQVMPFYKGPEFRTFNFSYQLLPHSSADQSKIKMIIDFFKTASAPEQISSGLFRIYELPYIFTINFYGINGEMRHMSKIAHCALTAVDVKYGGDRFNTFAGTDAPVQTNLTLAFKEIELVTKIDMEKGY